jgi:cytochrome c peroxidase
MKMVANTSKTPSIAFVLLGGVLGGAAVYQQLSFSAASKSDIANIKKEIAQALDAEAERRGDGTSMAPTLIRLAWHAAGTYSAVDGTGGSNGAHMRFAPESNWGCNAGLKSARDFLEPIKKNHPEISYADLWTLAGATAVEEMGGPTIPWRQGRTDSATGTTVPDGRLPNADSGCTAADTAHLRDIFGRMGFNDKEIVCLAGAHAVGRCHTEASGYWGPWTNAETTFSNEYFRLLLEETWTLKKTHNGKKWTGPKQYENKDGSLMMLPADLTLVQEPAFRQHVEFYAKNDEAFNKDFAAVFARLLELGVVFPAEGKCQWDVLCKIKSFFGM